MDGRLILAAIVLIGGLTVAVAGASPQATLTPEAALDADPGDASVKGMIEQVDRSNGTFHLTDGETGILVRYGPGLPAAVANGSSLVAKGTLEHEGGQTLLVADEIQLGCPSKYEA